jgi:hypothetical protein
LWWGCFATSAFGGGPTTRDAVFRNSIAFKTVAEVAGITGVLDGRREECSPRELIESAAGEGRALKAALRIGGISGLVNVKAPYPTLPNRRETPFYGRSTPPTRSSRATSAARRRT